MIFVVVLQCSLLRIYFNVRALNVCSYPRRKAHKYKAERWMEESILVSLFSWTYQVAINIRHGNPYPRSGRSLLLVVFPPSAFTFLVNRGGCSSRYGRGMKSRSNLVLYVQVFSSSVVLMEEYGAAQLLTFSFVMVSFAWDGTLLLNCCKMVVQVFFSFALPLILLCKFTTSGDLARAHRPACLHIFFIVFGCGCSFFKNNPCPLGWK